MRERPRRSSTSRHRPTRRAIGFSRRLSSPSATGRTRARDAVRAHRSVGTPRGSVIVVGSSSPRRLTDRAVPSYPSIPVRSTAFPTGRATWRRRATRTYSGASPAVAWDAVLDDGSANTFLRKSALTRKALVGLLQGSRSTASPPVQTQVFRATLETIVIEPFDDDLSDAEEEFRTRRTLDYILDLNRARKKGDPIPMMERALVASDANRGEVDRFPRRQIPRRTSRAPSARCARTATTSAAWVLERRSSDGPARARRSVHLRGTSPRAAARRVGARRHRRAGAASTLENRRAPPHASARHQSCARETVARRRKPQRNIFGDRERRCKATSRSCSRRSSRRRATTTNHHPGDVRGANPFRDTRGELQDAAAEERGRRARILPTAGVFRTLRFGIRHRRGASGRYRSKSRSEASRCSGRDSRTRAPNDRGGAPTSRSRR